MKKMIAVLLTATILTTALTPITADAASRRKKVGTITTKLTATETTWDLPKYPYGTSVYRDDLSETTVTVSGSQPYRIETVVKFNVSLRPDELHGTQITKDLARKAFIRSNLPKALFDRNGDFSWHIKTATRNRLTAKAKLTSPEGDVKNIIFLLKHESGGWYAYYRQGGHNVDPDDLLDWAKSGASYSSTSSANVNVNNNVSTTSTTPNNDDDSEEIMTN